MHSVLPKITLAAATVASIAAVVAPVASADSIVYVNVQDGNVWVAKPDGSQARAVTHDATAVSNYRNTSQADDGTILAVRDGKLMRFDRQGKLVNEIPSIAGGAVKGPFDPKISPDGTKVAYDVYVSSNYETPGGIYYSIGSYVVWADARTGEQIGDTTSSFESPSWLGDSQHALVFDPFAYFTNQMGVAGVGASNKGDVQPWLTSQENPIGFGELNRSEDRLALQQAPTASGSARDNGNLIGLYTVAGHTGDPTGENCEIRDPQGRAVRDPSWSPTGRSLTYWAPGSGIWTTPFDGTCGSLAPKVIINNGGQGDWGPADPGAAAGASPTPSPSPTPTVKPDGEVKVKPTVGVAGSVKRLALRRGLKVRVTAGAGSEADVIVRDGDKTIGTAAVTVPAAGATVRVKLKSTRKLGRKGHRRLAVKVLTAGGSASAKVNVRR